MLVNVSMKFHEVSWTVLKLESGHNFVTETATYKIQGCITQKKCISKCYGSCALHVVQCWLIFTWSFMKISWTVSKLQSGHDFVRMDGQTDGRPGQKQYEPWHDKTNKTSVRPTKTQISPAWAFTQSDQSLLCAQWVAKDTMFLHADTED